MTDHIRSAISSIRSNKVRSVLTTLGVVIGVAAVTTLVSLGQGLKNEVAALIRGFGTNVIVVVAGKVAPGQGGGPSNPANFISGDILTREDFESVAALEDVEVAAPVSLVPGAISRGQFSASGAVLGSLPTFADAFQVLKLEGGRMFSPEERGVIVLGPAIRKELFGDEDPLGKSVILGKEAFEVIGTFAPSPSSGLFGSEFDSLSVIPFDDATRLNRGQEKIFRIAARARDSADVRAAQEAIRRLLLDRHGTEDFTVLTQDDILNLFGSFLNLATVMVSAVAAISLVVGGIGIMNIMLVTVTERTREIGLRKALGATRGAIVLQFLTEAVAITLLGGIIGLLVSFAVGAIIAARTPLTPEISVSVIVIAVGISTAIGVVFGLWPAIRAARKDPVESLRYE